MMTTGDIVCAFALVFIVAAWVEWLAKRHGWPRRKTESVTQACKNCLFWAHPFKDGEQTDSWHCGSCHRHAPAPSAPDAIHLNPSRIFPVTNARDFCGDWQADPRG